MIVTVKRLLEHRWTGSLILVALILVLGCAVYWPVLKFNFFWEDPADIGKTEEYSFSQMWLRPIGSGWYRPLMVMSLKWLRGNQPYHVPMPYYAFSLGAHLAAALLLFGGACRWFKNRSLAFVAAVIFLLNPIMVESVRAASSHGRSLVPMLGALWLYTVGREEGKRWPIIVALLLGVAALLINENGFWLPLLVLSLEAYLVCERHLSRFSWVAFSFLIPVVLFVGVWFLIPRSGGEFQLELTLPKTLYLSQSLSFPFAGMICQTGGWGLDPNWQAAIAFALSMVTLLVGHGRPAWRRLALLLAWWGFASISPWIALSFKYLRISPRLMTFACVPTALMWASLVGMGEWNVKRILGWFVALCVVLQSLLTTVHLIDLYQAGSRLMDEIVAAGQTEERLLFVNVPDRFEYRDPIYPVGFWGMMLAPASHELADFVQFASGTQMQTISLSDLPLLEGMLEASPYWVSPRGMYPEASEMLYEKALWADQTYVTDYFPDGSLSLRAVGSVDASQITKSTLGQFGETTVLLEASPQVTDTAIDLVLYWEALRTANPADTVFVHLYDATGKLVAQDDGDSLGDLLPLHTWQIGHEIQDRRAIPIHELPPGEYQLAVGMYNRVDGQRYPAQGNAGVQAVNDALVVGQVTLSSTNDR